MRNFTILAILLFFFFIDASCQTRKVAGRLIDPLTGLPMPGVNVVIKGTSIGTTTDINGDYEVEAPVGSVLVFSFVGYKTEEVEVKPDSKAPSGMDDQHQKLFRHTIPDDPERTLSPYFFIKSDDPSVDQMPLKSTSSEVHIAGVIADVKVSQLYVNTGMHPLEAVYIFPGSTRAAVHAMSMTIGRRRLVAKIREKEQARKDYEEAREVGKTATLLEQKRPNLFQMNVANIMPGDSISVELRYTEVLVPVNGTYEFIYPTVVGPRYSETPDNRDTAGEKWIESPYQSEGKAPYYSFDLKTTLNTGIPTQRITSSSHKVTVDYKSKSSAHIRLDSTETFGGNRDFILKYQLRGGKIESGLLLYPRHDENFFLLMMEPPDAPTMEEIPPREYIFIVDVSGSMQGFPLSVSKRLLRQLVSSLRPDDLFNVLLFESGNYMLHPRSVKATDFNIASAVRLIDKAQGGGGTRLYSALQSAFEYEKSEGYSRTFVVITDGFVTVEKEAFNLVRDNLGTANLFAFGIGSSVNRYLIEGLAHAGMGEPFVVTNENEADAIGKKFIEMIEHPVLTNIKIDYGSFDVYDETPISIPDVFVQRPIVIFGKYKGKTNGVIRLSGYSGTRPYGNRIDVSTADSENNEGLRYLWARNQIKYLDDFAQFYEDQGTGQNRQEAEGTTVKKVTQLGLRYNLLTQYTSFIAVDSTIRNHENNGGSTSQPLPLPQGVSNSAVSLAGMTLSPDITSLSEVIVTGYGAQEKKSITASVQTVRSSSIEPSISWSLQGRVAGVVVNQVSPDPASSQSVSLRGAYSLSSANEPLFVVDGIPVDNTEHPAGPAGADYVSRINDINPSDISSIQVLKGSNASAIYGSRGANGVIIITTKKPQVGKPKVGFMSSISMQEVSKLPELQNSFAQGQPYGGVEQWQGPETGTNFSWGPALNQLTYDGSDYAYDQQGRLIPITSSDLPAGAYDHYKFFRKGIRTDNYISLANSVKKWNYSIAVGDTRQSGVIPGADYNRTTLALFGENDRKRVKIGSRIFLAHSGTDALLRGNSPSSVMLGLLTTPPSFDNGNSQVGRDALKMASTYELSDGSQRSYSPDLVDNPYWSINKNPFKSTINRLVGKLYADFDLARELSLKSNVSADHYVDRQRSGFDIGSNAASRGQFTYRDEEYLSVNSELILDGRMNAINGDLEISGITGLVAFISKKEITRTDGFDLQTAGVFVPENAEQLLESNMSYNLKNARLFSSVGLDYKHLLSFDLKSVWERTSTLAEGSLWSSGIGVAFNFSQLSAFSSSSVLTSGKVFASAGRIQKEAPLFIDPNYLLAGSADISSPILSTERIGAIRTPGLNAEQVLSVETGATIGLFQDRFEVTMAGYVNETYNLIVPKFAGLTASLVNAGTLATKGLDISVQAMPVSGPLQWSVGINFTTYRSIVKKLDIDVDRIPLAGFQSVSKSLIEGSPYGVFMGTKYLRNEQGSNVIGSDGFPLVDPTPGIIGDPNPDWLMGVENSLSYNRLTLKFLINTRQGGMIWNGTGAVLNYFGTSMSTGKERETKNYVFDGVGRDGEPNSIAVDFIDPSKDVKENRWTRYGPTGVAEDAMEDGSWLRLSELSLSYQFNDNLKLPFGLRRLTVTLTGRNLFLITKYSGIDPDTNLTGTSLGTALDYFNLPNVRSYGFALRAGL